ncbi:sensor histidine kinase [Petroclostridium xylanilyticum]|uniref:sensor histidine kinase n=1 Tax=Petroclostridium xylanilyticum TaxID=1792311 RepID=UPI0018E3EFF0|nr:sensor histidine kinase [Petroclostridium xylanilyticum]
MFNVKISNFYEHCKQKYYDYPLNLQINVIIGFIILATIAIITAITYIKSFNYIKESFKETGLLILQETTDKINARLKLVENTALMISTDSRIQDYLDSSKSVSESEVGKYLNSCIDFNKYDIHDKGLTYIQNLIDDIIFVTHESTVIARRLHFTAYNFRNHLGNEWFQNAYQAKGKLVWTNCFYNNSAEQILKNSNTDINAQLNQFMLIRYIVNEKNFKDIGYIAISINLENMSRLIDNIRFGKHGNLYIINESGNILASENRGQLLKTIEFDKNTMNRVMSYNGSQSFFEGTVGKEQSFIFSAPLSINNWKLIITIPVSELKNSVSSTLLSIISIGILSFFVIASISTFILNNVSHPLKKIVTSIKEIRNGNLSQKVNVKGCLEVNQLSTEFNFMIDKINSLLDKIVDEQKALRKSELKALRAQINPHFLYNTLDSIKWLVLSGNAHKASKLIASLSTFFRIGLSGGSEEILIKEEVEHAKHYLFIQKLRCGEMMDYLIDVEPEIEQLKTPKLILQPIVENAIIHGLNKKEGNGFIKIIVKKRDDRTIAYEITDNGIGMKPEELEELNVKINDPLLQSTAGNHGYAIRNVNQRIKLCYGDGYGITYKSKYNVGTKVTVTIPIASCDQRTSMEQNFTA